MFFRKSGKKLYLCIQKMKYMKKSYFLKIMLLSLISVFTMACSSDDKDSDELVVKGLVENAGVTEDVPVVFTTNNIVSFNLSTREFKLQGVDMKAFCNTYSKIRFEINNESLFKANVVTLEKDGSVLDLVLLYDDENGKCYLNDCYPMSAFESEEVQDNAQKRINGWKRFVKHLNDRGKLQE